MSDVNLKRRDFSKLTMAAFGGMLAGSATSALGAEAKSEKPKISVDPALLLEEPHVCRGLNTCKGKGKDGKNSCAGQGTCAGVKAISCAGENDCKGQGGCGGYPGQNTCKGKGHCAVPLDDRAWAIARSQLQHLMKDLGKKIGEAPKKG